MERKIIYTITDEAPALATVSLLPILKKFLAPAGIEVETRDISLAGRILANFPDYLTPEQRIPDDLTELGTIVDQNDANVIKLPNISASIPQLTAAVRELQEQGYKLPDYPDKPQTDEQREIKRRYDLVKGSAVNPVLRQGNSDRRSPRAVKEYARKHPHSMGAWSSDSKSHIAFMSEGDYYGSERSTVIPEKTEYRIIHTDPDGKKTVLKTAAPLLSGEVIDSAIMKRDKLRDFAAREIEDARKQKLLFSVHLKATMMKVSDPIIFGHVVEVYFKKLFEKHREIFAELKIIPNNGLRDLYERISVLPKDKQEEILGDIRRQFEEGPSISMVDSARGITSFDVPSDFIIDSTIPSAIRSSGKTWGPDGSLGDTKFVVPDRSYASLYQVVIDFCRKHGAFDPSTMGSVSNIGLMAGKAEEYGSHDKTFEMDNDGAVQVVDTAGKVLLEQEVGKGDIFRMCQVKDASIRDWVGLCVNRAGTVKQPAIFWLDEDRAHDKNIIDRVKQYLGEYDTTGLDIRIMKPEAAMQFTLERLKEGLDTISVTGNVLRDYLTDLFPILELGTSAKMLSIVRLLKGGGLFETGSAGSAPKHVQQFVEEGHLRWDSLGEYMALSVSLEHLSHKSGFHSAQVLADTLDSAIGIFLENGKSPSRKAGELDTRGSHFYLAWYWAQALAEQDEDPMLKKYFAPLAENLGRNESIIIEEFNQVQKQPIDIGGYFHPDMKKTENAMRASKTFKEIIDTI